MPRPPTPPPGLYRNGNGRSSRMAFMGHVLRETRNGLVAGACLTQTTGTAERAAALALVEAYRPGRRRITLGVDKADDVAAFVAALRERRITPHLTRDDHLTKTGKRRRTSTDGRTTRYPSYAVSMATPRSSLTRRFFQQPASLISLTAANLKVRACAGAPEKPTGRGRRLQRFQEIRNRSATRS